MSVRPERRRGVARWGVACLLWLAGNAAADETPGNPPLQFFGPRDYNAGPLNWSVLQDSRGLVYAANADGVHLAVAGSPVIGSLKSLESKGVRLILCSTCLNYYQQAENVQVGIVGGMTDIIEAQFRAAKVISI